MKKLKSLSIFFPSLNDSKILPYLIYKADKVARGLTTNYEIIIINDGSTDDTRTVLQAMQKLYPELRVIHHKKNKGYGGALISGFNAAKKEWIFYTDGDGQYDVGELPLLIQKISPSVDIVNGYKLNRVDNTARKIIGGIYNEFVQTVYKLPIRDVDCDFRLIRRSMLKKINLYSQSGMICMELVIKLYYAGGRFKEVGVHHYPRRFGTSQFFNIKHIFRTLFDHFSFFRKTKVMRKSLSTYSN